MRSLEGTHILRVLCNAIFITPELVHYHYTAIMFTGSQYLIYIYLYSGEITSLVPVVFLVSGNIGQIPLSPETTNLALWEL